MKRINLDDIVGKKFNRLLVLSFDHSKPHPNPTKGNFYFYKCQCECGNITFVKRERLISLETKSCGCYGKEVRRALLSTKRIYSHRLYRIWCGMKSRCYNKKDNKYPLYIERINVNGNYTPNNCTWANAKVQANNRTNNHLIFYNNQTHTLSEWATILKINRSTLWYRIKRGWSIERAFSTPKQ